MDNAVGSNTPVKSTLTQDMKVRDKSQSKNVYPPFKAGVPSPIHASKSKLEPKVDEPSRPANSKENKFPGNLISSSPQFKAHTDSKPNYFKITSNKEQIQIAALANNGIQTPQRGSKF